MKSENLLILQESELDKDITFELSKDIKVTAKLMFKKEDIIEPLIARIKKLEDEVKKLNKLKIRVVEDSLTGLWENEYDERWNKC